MSERWLPVVGHEGLYEVSDFGRVRSCARRLGAWFGARTKTELIRVLRRRKGNGYVEINLQARPRPIRWALVHRLVLEAFVGPCQDGREARHMDGNRQNNRVGNLSWSTHLENMSDQYRHGTRIAGDKHPGTKLTEEFARWVAESSQSGVDAAHALGVTTNIVSRIKCGHTYTCAVRGNSSGVAA